MSREVGFGPFSFRVPEDWTLTSVVLSGPVEVAGDTDAGVYQQTLMTTAEAVAPDETATRFVERQNAALAATGGLQTVGPDESVSLGASLTGVLSERIVAGLGGGNVRQMQLVYIKDGVAVTAIASQIDGPAFEAARRQFRSILLSFR